MSPLSTIHRRATKELTTGPAPARSRRSGLIRKALLSGLALAMALSPSVAQANLYGTYRTSPFQFANWMGRNLFHVKVTHHYGVYTDTYDMGTVYQDEVRRGMTVAFYTGGTFTATDYWTITGSFNSSDGNTMDVYRSLYSYKLTSVDAGVMFTVNIGHGSYSN